MPVIPKPTGLGSTQNGEDPEDPIESESQPSGQSHAIVASQEPSNESGETLKEPVRLSLKSSKPATSLLSSVTSKLTSQPLGWLQSATKPITSLFSSSKQRSASSIPYPGLDNLGHTCYINSCTHSILLAPFFRDSLKSLNSRIEKYVYSRPGIEDLRFDSHMRLIREFHNLSEGLLVKYNKNKAVNSFGSIRPLNYLHSLSEVDNRYGAGSEQQDVQEFFVFLLSALDDGAKMLKEKIEKKELILENSANEKLLESLFEPSETNETTQFEDSTSESTVERENGSKKRFRPENFSSAPGDGDDDDDRDTVPISIGTGSPSHKKAKMQESLYSSISFNPDGSSSGPLLATTQELSDGFQLSYESQSMEEPKKSEDSMDIDETPSVNMSIAVGDKKSLKEVESMSLDAENGATEAKKTEKEEPLPHELFQGEITSTFQCVECERESGRPEAFFDISLPIEKGKGLYDSLGEHFSKHILRGQEKYECDTCRHMNEAFHYQRISKLPHVLTVHLKRFSWSGGMADSVYGLRPGIRGNGVGKLNFHIDCPFDLEIPRSWLSTKYQQEFLHQSTVHSTLPPSSDGPHPDQDNHMALSSSSDISLAKSLVLQSRDVPLANYQLYGIIYHSGSSTTFGHYTAAIRVPDEEENENEPRWALFDDQSVSPVSHAWVMQSISEKSPMSGTAYILLYKRLFQ